MKGMVWGSTGGLQEDSNQITSTQHGGLCFIPSLCRGHLQRCLGKRELGGVHSHLHILQEGVCRGGEEKEWMEV